MPGLKWLDRVAGRGGVTILMYHSVCQNPECDLQISVTPAAFERQMTYIASRYPVIRLGDVPDALSHQPGSSRRVVITFDDACRDFVHAAYPILKRLNLPASVFVPTGMVGQPHVMTLDDIRAIHREGLVSFGSHTVDHLDMRQLTADEMRYQALMSRWHLEDWLGAPVTSFAYPFGQRHNFSRATTKALADAGYAIALTTCWKSGNRADQLLTLSRIFLSEHDTESAMRAKVEGLYDWHALKEQTSYAARSLVRAIALHQAMSAGQTVAGWLA